MRSQKIIQIINLAQHYKCKPSEILRIPEEYDAFCLDEACAYIHSRMQEGETPMFKKKYSTFSDVYRGLNQRGVICQ